MNNKLFINLDCRRPNKLILLADFPNFATVKKRGQELICIRRIEAKLCFYLYLD